MCAMSICCCKRLTLEVCWCCRVLMCIACRFDDICPLTARVLGPLGLSCMLICDLPWGMSSPKPVFESERVKGFWSHEACILHYSDSAWQCMTQITHVAKEVERVGTNFLVLTIWIWFCWTIWTSGIQIASASFSLQRCPTAWGLQQRFRSV